MTSADSPQPIAGFREATNVRSATLLTQHSQMSVDATATTSPQPRPTAEPRSDLITNWEEQVQTILSSPTPDPDKANALLEIFPHVPEEGKSEVVATLVPLLPDSQFADLGQYLTN